MIGSTRNGKVKSIILETSDSMFKIGHKIENKINNALDSFRLGRNFNLGTDKNSIIEWLTHVS